MNHKRSHQSSRTLQAVRGDVAAIDRQIVALLAQRAPLADEAVGFKTSIDDISDISLQAGLLARIEEWAGNFGAPSALARSVYSAILEYSVARQIAVFQTSGRGQATDTTPD